MIYVFKMCGLDLIGVKKARRGGVCGLVVDLDLKPMLKSECLLKIYYVNGLTPMKRKFWASLPW